jgi:hypothetical protein
LRTRELFEEDWFKEYFKTWRNKESEADSYSDLAVVSRFPLVVDFGMEVTTYEYFGFLDLIASLGGISSSFGIAMKFLTPLLVFSFFYQLGKIIKDYRMKTYVKQLLDSSK